jgi:NSS family neurotransmitter:Na+ symporter
MPGGRLVGTLFFVLLVFAAITPTIAGFEPLVAWLQQRWRLSRARAVIAAVFGGWLFSIGGLLSPKFFAVMDFVPPNIMLPLGALATSVFVGWRISRTILASELSETTPFGQRWCVWALRYVCPIAIGTVFVAAFW